MAFLSSFGAYVPLRVVANAELAAKLGCPPEWIAEVSGIEERRYAAADESVIDMSVAAAQACRPATIGMLIVASGSFDRQFPGPASQIAERLGWGQIPALDLPIASAGGLFAMVLASRLTAAYGNILVIAAEKMSAIAAREPLDKNVAILFGDGAGACVVSADAGAARIVDSVIHSDGAFAESLYLERGAALHMNGLSVILQASRKIPAAIREVLDRNGRTASQIELFLMHQANQNLIDRVARALDVPTATFYSNIRRYGNTSSASMLIAAAECWRVNPPSPGAPVCFAAFGAGFHWGALLAESITCQP